MITLAAFEEIIDASGTAPRIEAMLPAGVRARQLLVRTLLPGMLLALADHRPAHLTRVHQALTVLGEERMLQQVLVDDGGFRRRRHFHLCIRDCAKFLQRVGIHHPRRGDPAIFERPGLQIWLLPHPLSRLPLPVRGLGLWFHDRVVVVAVVEQQTGCRPRENFLHGPSSSRLRRCTACGRRCRAGLPLQQPGVLLIRRVWGF
jgi:hypothetical protein